MNRKLLLIIVILIMGVIAGNWIYGNILAKKIEASLEERVKLLSEDWQLEVDKIKVNPLLSKLQFKGLVVKTVDGKDVAEVQEMVLDMPYHEAMRLLKSKQFDEIKSLKLKCSELAVFMEAAGDKLLAEELIIDFEGHLTKKDIENLDTKFPDTKQELSIDATELSLAQTPWMNNLGFTPEQIEDYNQMEELSMHIVFDPKKQEIELEDFHMYSPLLSLTSNGKLNYAGEGIEGMETLKTQSSFNCQLNKGGISWGDPETTGKFSLGNFHIKTDGVVAYQDEIPMVESQTASFLIEDLKVEYSGNKKDQLQAQTALLGIDVNNLELEKLALNSNLRDQKLIISDSEIKSSLLDATLKAELEINAMAPQTSQIKKGKLVVSKLQPGLQNALSTFELMTGQSL
ncbi:MAG: hypothetical protein N4A74_00400, partial [Carboxylicivirga sp.]|nr:hypothetical protein [Carboxylicivirga sp.]